MDQERQELYKTIWGLANKLRGSVDGWDFKNYVLGFLFYRYISEDFAAYVKKRVNAEENFDYSKASRNDQWIEGMKKTFIEEKGYFIYPEQLFSNVKKRSENNHENLNEEIIEIFKEIEESTLESDSKSDFSGLFKLIDLTSVKLGNEIIHKNKKIVEILKGISDMNLKSNESDMFGDAYEYLIGMYASNAGKVGGEYFTPPEISELLVNLVSSQNTKIRTVYDPTCGSGSLLLKFLKIHKNKEELEFYGQEINITTYNLCRMNMFLHHVGYEKFEIKCEDTLTNDQFKERKFDAIVSNPPFSLEWNNSEFKNDPRFLPAGALAPNSAADLAFVLHSLHHLESHGIAAIVCFPGILKRKQTEKAIRKYLVEENYIDAIILLSNKMFYGTPTSTCVMILKKFKKEPGILFINASKIFEKRKKRNVLNEENIRQIVDFYKAKKDVPNYVKMVRNEEIRKNDYNLMVGVYVEEEEIQEEIDIDALNRSIKERTKRMEFLRSEIDELMENF